MEDGYITEQQNFPNVDEFYGINSDILEELGD